jgi:hypothetical protein
LCSNNTLELSVGLKKTLAGLAWNNAKAEGWVFPVKLKIYWYRTTKSGIMGINLFLEKDL